jgi:transposase
MGRRAFTREFKLEAVRLIRDRGVSLAQASRDLGVHANVLCKWARDLEADPQQAFPGKGVIASAEHGYECREIGAFSPS